MSKFVKKIGHLNTTYDYQTGITLCANTETCYIKRKKDKVIKPRSSKGRSLVLRRSTKRGR